MILMRTLSLLARGIIAGLVALAMITVGFSDQPGAVPRVEFVIGDYLTDEGGSWQPSLSPVQGPFGIDFDQHGSMYIVELVSGRLLKRDTNGELTKLSEHEAK